MLPAQKLAQSCPGTRGALLYHAAVPPAMFDTPRPRGVPRRIHLLADDEWAQEEAEAAQALVQGAPDAELFVHPGSGHLFAEPGLPDYDSAAAALLLQRTLTFLARLRSLLQAIGREEPQRSGRAGAHLVASPIRVGRRVVGVEAVSSRRWGRSRPSASRRGPAGVAVVVFVAITLAASPVGTPARADGPEWAGEWVIWEGYQTGEETALRLEAYPATLAEFEAALPPWAERLRGLCGPAGRFYRGAAGGAEVLACEPSGYASGLWREGYLLLGAMSDWISALAPDPDLSLFGLGNEVAENAPFSTSPADRYFWGHTIKRTPTPERPQGASNTAGANDWHGRCMSGACAGSTTTTTQGAGAATTLPSLEAELSGIRLEETDMECSNTDRKIYLLAARTPTRDWEWFQNEQNISTIERVVAEVRPGTLVTVPAGVEVEVFGPDAWAYWKGPAVGRVYCEPPFDYPGLMWELLFGEGLWSPDPRHEPITINTPYVVATVMGTQFILDVTDAETRVVVLEGTVEVTGITAGSQVVTADHETASGGDGVPAPTPTDPVDLAARYPWLEDALRAAADPPGPSVLEAATGEQGGASGSSFPVWPVVAGAALVTLAVGGFAWARARSRSENRSEAPPPPEVGTAPPPPPPPE